MSIFVALRLSLCAIHFSDGVPITQYEEGYEERMCAETSSGCAGPVWRPSDRMVTLAVMPEHFRCVMHGLTVRAQCLSGGRAVTLTLQPQAAVGPFRAAAWAGRRRVECGRARGAVGPRRHAPARVWRGPGPGRAGPGHHVCDECDVV
jgi:hypothetical protein